METHRYLALGDSYTIGEGVAAAQRWPMQLATALRKLQLAIDDPQIIATTGWTTDELVHAMTQTPVHPPYALVTLLIGVNDQYRGRAATHFPATFQPLVERAIALTGERPSNVVVASIPDWGITPFGQRDPRGSTQIGRDIDAYNAAASAIVEQAGAHWVDVTAISRAYPQELIEDGLHPCATQYARWVDQLLPAVQAALASAT